MAGQIKKTSNFARLLKCKKIILKKYLNQINCKFKNQEVGEVFNTFDDNHGGVIQRLLFAETRNDKNILKMLTNVLKMLIFL